MGYKFLCRWIHIVGYCFFVTHSPQKTCSCFYEFLMPCPFAGPKIFCASPNFLSQPKNLTAISASSKTFVPAQKNNFTEFKLSFFLAQHVNRFFVWHKKFGPAQNILGPAKGQGISYRMSSYTVHAPL